MFAAEAYVNIGWVTKLQGTNLDEALSTYQKALPIFRKAVGEDHPHLANVFKNIGEVLAMQDKLDEAMKYLAMSLKIYTDKVGDRNPGVAEVRLHMGTVRQKEGKLEDALVLLEEAQQMFAENGKRQVMEMLQNTNGTMSRVLRQLGRGTEANEVDAKAKMVSFLSVNFNLV